jgi:hypothetical protein
MHMGGTMQRIAVIASLVAAGCTAEISDAPEEEALQIAVIDDSTIEGTFAYGGSFLQFRSVSADQGSATLWLDVNGVVVDVSLDMVGMRFEQDGHLGALYEDDRKILEAFSGAFEAAHPDFIDTLQGTLLVRQTNRLAEAPNGYTLDKRVIDMRTVEDPIVNTGATCSNDGLTCLPGVHGMAYAYFDRSGATCERHWRQYGKYEPSCAGRCGSGCNSWDRNYTQDCFDHDWCTKIISGAGGLGSDPNCGDEFWHADDDYAKTFFPVCG